MTSKYRLWKPKIPEESVTVSSRRTLILNRSATERLDGCPYVTLWYKKEGRQVAIQGTKDKQSASLKLHLSKGKTVATISATGLLTILRYPAQRPAQRFPLVWVEKKGWLQCRL
jgi:hypothetical protein